MDSIARLISKATAFVHQMNLIKPGN